MALDPAHRSPSAWHRLGRDLSRYGLLLLAISICVGALTYGATQPSAPIYRSSLLIQLSDARTAGYFDAGTASGTSSQDLVDESVAFTSPTFKALVAAELGAELQVLVDYEATPFPRSTFIELTVRLTQPVGAQDLLSALLELYNAAERADALDHINIEISALEGLIVEQEADIDRLTSLLGELRSTETVDVDAVSLTNNERSAALGRRGALEREVLTLTSRIASLQPRAELVTTASTPTTEGARSRFRLAAWATALTLVTVAGAVAAALAIGRRVADDNDALWSLPGFDVLPELDLAEASTSVLTDREATQSAARIAATLTTTLTAGTRTIALMAPTSGVGRTTTALLVGSALARAGTRTLLIDADASSSLSRRLGSANRTGLSETLDGGDVAQHLVQVDLHEQLLFLPSGGVTSASPAPGVASLSRFLQENGEIADCVIVDCGSASQLERVLPWCVVADDVVLIASSGRFTARRLRHIANQTIGRTSTRAWVLITRVPRERRSWRRRTRTVRRAHRRRRR